MNNKTQNMLNFRSAVRELQELDTLEHVRTSVQLVAESVFQLFISNKPSTISRKLLRVETLSDVNKRSIIYFSKNFNGDELLSFLNTLSAKDFTDIGPEFFYITARKFSKNQSIDEFAKFTEIMIRHFGYDVNFVRAFFSNTRDGHEVGVLVRHMKKWESSQFSVELDQIVKSTILTCMEKLSSFNLVHDVLELSQKFADYFTDNKDYQVNLQKILINMCYAVVLKNFNRNIFADSLSMIKGMGYVFNNAICSKMLEIMNRNFKSSHLADILFKFMEENKIKPNLITLNTIIDCYCLTGRFDQAYLLFNTLTEKNYKPDNFTYSILIKGIKNMNSPDVDLALRLFHQYKVETFEKSVVLYNSIIDVLVNQGDINKADEIFKEVQESEDMQPDQITFNTLIKGCYKNKDIDNAIKYYMLMKENELTPNRITYNSLMDLAVKVEKMDKAFLLLKEMQKDNITADGFTYSIILNGLKINNSGVTLVQNSLETLKKVLSDEAFKLDEVIFNSIFDVCSKYDLFAYLAYFYRLMKEKGVTESVITYGILLKAYCKTEEFEKTLNIFNQMRQKNMAINEVIYGHVLDCCTKSGRMDIALKIYDNLKKSNLGISSIVFTTIMTGFVKQQRYKEGIDFFNDIKHYTELGGMLITYNCALDIHVRNEDIESALELFEKIENTFNTDLISYSTIIKGLCKSERKPEALEYVKKMISIYKDLDISVVNLFLDSCSTPKDFKLGIQGYQYAMMKNIIPNEVTFGIMVKIFGFSRELRKAFDLLDLMDVYEIPPSIIIFTNLIHISFYNSNPRKAELAYTLFKRQKLEGDKLLYSKLIDGFIRYKEFKKVPKYIDLTLEDECGLKPDTIERITKKYGNNEGIMDKLVKIREFGKRHRKPQYANKSDRYKPNNPPKPQNVRRQTFKSNRFEGNNNNTQKSENKRFIANTRPKRSFNDYKTNNNNNSYSNTNKNFSKKPLALFNFRNKK